MLLYIKIITMVEISGTVLISGIYLAEQENNIENIVSRFNTPSKWHVVQKWIAVGEKTVSDEVRQVTVMNIQNGLPKFSLLNTLLAEETLGTYDFIIVSDDDISMPIGFLDTYLDLVVRYNFALAQPARTHKSYIDHPFVEQLDGLKARRTRFVEIGPVISIRRDAFTALLPFDESASMGWGLDFVWPCIIEKLGLRMGIIDAIPVEHSMRKPVKHYRYDETNQSMKEYLSLTPHLSKDEAFRIHESYA